MIQEVRHIRIDARAMQTGWDDEAARARGKSLLGRIRAAATTAGPGGGTLITGTALVLLGWLSLFGAVALLGGAR